MGTLSKDYHLEHARGGVPRLKFVSKFGENEDIDPGTVPETIWGEGGVWVPPTQARVHDVTSTDAGDTAAGTGAQQILIEGLDENFDELSAVIETNGLTPVPTPLMQRIHRLTVLRAGATKSNIGTIRATAQVDLTVTCMIKAGDGGTLSAIWTVPRNHRAYVTEINADIWRAGASLGAMASGRFIVTFGIDTPNPVEFSAFNFGVTAEGAGLNRIWRHPRGVGGPADIRCECTLMTDMGTIMSAGFAAYYEVAN